MKYLSSALSDSECESFQKFWQQHEAERAYVNWEEKGKVLDRRLRILPTDPEWEIIMRIASQNFSNIDDIWAAYQSQEFAHNLHIDEYAKEQSLPTYTCVLSVITEPKFKTITWKESDPDNLAMQQKLMNFWDLDPRPEKMSDISQTEDLEQTPNWNGTYFVDYLTLDGIFSYKKGDGMLFNARQYHCTSNWTKYPEFKTREFLQIHIVSKDIINLDG